MKHRYEVGIDNLVNPPTEIIEFEMDDDATEWQIDETAANLAEEWFANTHGLSVVKLDD